MRLPALIFVGGFGEASLEGVEVEGVELDGIEQSLVLIVSVEVTAYTVFDGCWIFEDLISRWPLFRPELEHRVDKFRQLRGVITGNRLEHSSLDLLEQTLKIGCLKGWLKRSHFVYNASQ